MYTYHLNTAGVTCAKKILCVLEHCNPDIVYSPLLYSLVSVFLHYMDVNDCYNCVYSLLRSNGFITQTKVSYEASKLVIKDLAKKYAVSSSEFINLVFCSIKKYKQNCCKYVILCYYYRYCACFKMSVCLCQVSVILV